jgi:neural Wiskott-Aldrich syndrome protein
MVMWFVIFLAGLLVLTLVMVSQAPPGTTRERPPARPKAQRPVTDRPRPARTGPAVGSGGLPVRDARLGNGTGPGAWRGGPQVPVGSAGQLPMGMPGAPGTPGAPGVPSLSPFPPAPPPASGGPMGGMPLSPAPGAVGQPVGSWGSAPGLPGLPGPGAVPLRPAGPPDPVYGPPFPPAPPPATALDPGVGGGAAAPDSGYVARHHSAPGPAGPPGPHAPAPRAGLSVTPPPVAGQPPWEPALPPSDAG